MMFTIIFGKFFFFKKKNIFFFVFLIYFHSYRKNQLLVPLVPQKLSEVHFKKVLRLLETLPAQPSRCTGPRSVYGTPEGASHESGGSLRERELALEGTAAAFDIKPRSPPGFFQKDFIVAVEYTKIIALSLNAFSSLRCHTWRSYVA